MDDEPESAAFLETLLGARGHEVCRARDGVEALLGMEAIAPDLIVSDLRMPNMDGMELLVHVRQRWPDLPFILISVNEEIPTVVRAIQAGAADYLLKPARPDEILGVVERALAASRDRHPPQDGMPEIVGISPGAVRIRHSVALAARCEVNVLISGATGTGKELVAGAIHRLSRSASEPFVAVNCAAIPGELFESHFFGHRKGSFTGASRDYTGYLARASGGVLFLDELESMLPHHQAKLLRVLDDGIFTPVGSTASQRSRFRVLAATNRDPESLVGSGELREDIFYRLRGLEIRLPSLSERLEDIPHLAAHFLGAKTARLTAEACAALQAHDWPGNVRELRESLQRAAVFAAGGPIQAAHLGLRRLSSAPGDRPTTGLARLEDLELEQIERTLAACGGNRSQAARVLGIDRSTLRRKLRKAPGGL